MIDGNAIYTLNTIKSFSFAILAEFASDKSFYKGLSTEGMLFLMLVCDFKEPPVFPM